MCVEAGFSYKFSQMYYVILPHSCLCMHIYDNLNCIPGTYNAIALFMVMLWNWNKDHCALDTS